MKLFCVALMLSLFSLSVTAHHVIGLDLPNRLQTDGDGHYNAMWKRMVELGFSHQLDVLPLKRAFRNFSEHEDSCLFPTTVESLTTSFPQFKGKKFISSNEVDYVHLKVMTRPGEPIISDLSSLNGKKVALWNGLDPNIFLAGLDVKAETTTSEEVRIRMLNSHRVDAILGFIPDTLIAAEKMQVTAPAHEGGYVFFDNQAVTMVCFESDKNRQLLNDFNQILSQIKSSGELQKILGPHARVHKKN